MTKTILIIATMFLTLCGVASWITPETEFKGIDIYPLGIFAMTAAASYLLGILTTAKEEELKREAEHEHDR